MTQKARISGLSLAFARMPSAEARGGMARGDRGVARSAKPGGFGVVPLGFATDAPPCGRGASFSCCVDESHYVTLKSYI
jgi:hypothetical protein